MSSPRQLIIDWLISIGCDQAEIDEVIEQCVADVEARKYYLVRAQELNLE